MAEKQKIPSMRTKASEKTSSEIAEEEFKEKQVSKNETPKEETAETAESISEAAEQNKNASQSSAFEGIYDRLPDISIRSLDRFILLCIIGLAAVILIGILKANHIL